MAKKVLIIEDEAPISRLIQVLLKREGYEVHAAANGLAGLETVAAHSPDLVLCDVMMPVLTGTEFRERIRANPATAQLPVVMLTGRSDGIPEQTDELAVDNYLPKPFDPEDLIALVKRYLPLD